MTQPAMATLSGSISGAGNLSITGSPTLAGANTYSGGTTLNANASPRDHQQPGLRHVNAHVQQRRIPGQHAFDGRPTPSPTPGRSRRLGRLLLRAERLPAFRQPTLPAGSENIHITNPALTVILSGLISGAGTLVRASDDGRPATARWSSTIRTTPSRRFTLQSLGGNVDVQGASTTGGPGGVTAGPLGMGTVTLNTANTLFSNLLNSSATPVTLANNLNIYDQAGFTSLSGLTFTGTTTLTGPGQWRHCPALLWPPTAT